MHSVQPTPENQLANSGFRLGEGTQGNHLFTRGFSHAVAFSHIPSHILSRMPTKHLKAHAHVPTKCSQCAYKSAPPACYTNSSHHSANRISSVRCMSSWLILFVRPVLALGGLAARRPALAREAGVAAAASGPVRPLSFHSDIIIR